MSRKLTFNQEMRYNILVPLVMRMDIKRQKEMGSLTKASAHEIYDETINKIADEVLKRIAENTTHNHTKCPLPLTCSGYESALEDVRYAINEMKKIK